MVAIGSPFSLPETVTQGIVSAVGRSITAPNNFTITGAIQTDAAINPGNSGGPLLDGDGHVLGLNDQIETNNTTSGQGSSSGVGFAIPSNMIARIANEIIAGKTVKHAFVGVFLNSSSTGGAQISSVQSGSPAASAGLHRATCHRDQRQGDRLDPAVHRDGRHLLAGSDDHAHRQARRQDQDDQADARHPAGAAAAGRLELDPLGGRRPARREPVAVSC